MGIGGRLKEERVRLSRTQTEFAEIGGCSKNTQLNYEKEDRSPDANYLSAIARIGVDIMYVLSGQRSESSLSTTEQTLIDLFRSAPGMLQAAALGALQAGLTSGTTGGVSSPPDTVKIKEVAGQMNTGSVTNQASTMNFGSKGS